MKYSSKIKSLIVLSLLALLLIQAPHIFAQTANTVLSNSNTNTNSNLAQDVQIINTILVKQGNIHYSVNPGNGIIISSQIRYALSTTTNCSLSLYANTNNSIHDTTSNDYIRDAFTDTFTVDNITSIDAKPTVSPDEQNTTYDGTYYRFDVHLNHPIIPLLLSHETSLAPYPTTGEISKFAIIIRDADDAKKIVDALTHSQKLCGANFPLNSEGIGMADDEQAHFQQVIAHGKPAQMYAAALDMADSGHNTMALQMFQAIIDKYPDDAYAAKAIDKREALRNTMKHGNANTNINSTSNGTSNNTLSLQRTQSSLQHTQQCQSSCQNAKNSCDMNYSNNMGTQLGNTINSLRGHNSAVAQQSGSQILGDPNACQHQYDSCNASCGG
jgi:hypothetical protein